MTGKNSCVIRVEEFPTLECMEWSTGVSIRSSAPFNTLQSLKSHTRLINSQQRLLRSFSLLYAMIEGLLLAVTYSIILYSNLYFPGTVMLEFLCKF